MEEIQYTIRVLPDSSNPNLVYVGEAYPGSSETSPVWRIRRVDNTGGSDHSIVLYADGNTYFDNVWSSRETLSYS